MTQEEYGKLFSYEKSLFFLMGFLMPVLLFIFGLCFLMSDILEEFGEFTMITIIPIFYMTIFVIVYRKGVFSLKTKSGKEGFLFRSLRSSKFYFDTVGFPKAIIRLNFVDRILRYSIIALVLMSIFTGIVLQEISKNNSEVNEFSFKMSLVLLLSVMILGVMTYTIFFLRFPVSKIRDFHFYFSVGCFKILQRYSNMDEMEKRKYIIQGIEYYDKFLKKNLRMRINNIDKITSKILPESSEKLTESASSMLDRLEQGNKLELVKYLGSKLEGNESSSFLTKDPISDRIKELFPFIISTFTIIITVLGLIISQSN